MNEHGIYNLQCYCRVCEREPYMIPCQVCKILFHPGCLKSSKPSSLIGDVYFKLTCETCSPTGKEICERIRLQWILVVMLSLYNLKLIGGGKCGFFRWREHICNFIDRNWSVFFGTKKKTATWHGTVAGTLSAGCPTYFTSGTNTLNEAGWWTLTNSKLPTLDDLETAATNQNKAKRGKSGLVEPVHFAEGLRQRKTANVVQAALELKKKKADIQVASSSGRTAKNKKLCTVEEFVEVKLEQTNCVVEDPVVKHELEERVESNQFQDLFVGNPDDTVLPNELFSVAAEVQVQSEGKEAYILPDEPVNQWLNEDSEEEELEVDDIAIDPVLVSEPSSPSLGELLSVVSEKNAEESKSDSDEHLENSDEDNSMAIDQVVNLKKSDGPESGRKRKAIIKDEQLVKEEHCEPRYRLMNLYEEQQLLKELEKLSHVVNNPRARRLRRKLLVRQLKREKGLPVFDLDANFRMLSGMDQTQENKEKSQWNPTSVSRTGSSVLDRYQVNHSSVQGNFYNRTTFVTRLMGLGDEQRENIFSPYTERLLKPFIFRDFETEPLKLKLLREIIAYPHRNNPDWKPPPRHPIDFCYVQPEHIPAVNAFCHEFFWPGIDLSECLQYPDFSCVTLYRKVVIGFAFLVPDVTCDEAYITFFFTHPEWRRAGLANFMLYHLIQTCLTKDLTLHVSATNPALMLYQKFGFKVEEFILDFYDKYLPVNSKECRHAMFLRLSR